MEGKTITRNFNVRVSAREGIAFVGVVDSYTENKSVYSRITKTFVGTNDLNLTLAKVAMSSL